MKKIKSKEINKKFVLVGDGYCGKSTLIAAFYNRLVYNRKFVDKYTPTIFDTFTVTTDIYKKHINLEICDSAGQEEFSRVRPLSYPEVDAIILCFSVDSRESSQNILELWLPEIRHFCTNKVPIILVGCKIDLRVDSTTSTFNRHLMFKQEHLNRMNSFNNKNSDNQQNINNNNSMRSLHYGLYKTITSYCCQHERQCTCYHSKVCSSRCTMNLRRKASNASTSSNCLLNTSSNSENSRIKNHIMKSNRIHLQTQSPTRNSTNTEDSLSISDVEEVENNSLSNMNDSNYSLNASERKNSFSSHTITCDNSYSNSIYRHNQSMLNTLIHQQIEQQQCGHSLNSSETDESELTTDGQEDQRINESNCRDLLESNSLTNHNHLTSLHNTHQESYLLPVITDHLQSSIEQETSTIAQSKSQPLLIKNLKHSNRSKLLKGYKSFINFTELNGKSRSLDADHTQKSSANLKSRKISKTTSLKQKISTFLGVNSSVTSSLCPAKSEKKLSTLFYNRRLSTSNSNLPFSSFDNKTHRTDYNSSIHNGSFITTEEGLRLCAKIGAQAYVECSSKSNIGVDEVFKTALKLCIKHPISMKFNQLDMCSLN